MGTRTDRSRPQFFDDVVAAVVTGRVVETFAAGRSAVALTLANGDVVRNVGYGGGLISLIPLPGWRRWGVESDMSLR